MTTFNTSIGNVWTKVAASTDSELLITYDSPVSIEVATTATDTVPTVIGHILNREAALTRSVLGSGFVWAKTAAGSTPSSLFLVVTK